MMQSDPNLSNISHLILDEVHERDIFNDFLITWTRDLLKKRPDMKIVLMSATINSKIFSTYFGDCPVLEVYFSIIFISIFFL